MRDAKHGMPQRVGRGRLTLNFFFFLQNTNQTGLGMVVRDDLGSFVTANVMLIQGCVMWILVK